MSCGLKIHLAEFQFIRAMYYHCCFFHVKIDAVLQQVAVWLLAYGKEMQNAM